MGLTLKSKNGPNVIDVAVGKEAPVKDAPTSQAVATKVVGKEGKGVVTKTHHDGSMEEKQHSLGSIVSDTPLATVHVSLGMTKNLGNYESLKMTVGCTLPSFADESSLVSAYETAKAWCDEHLNQIVAEVNSELGQG